MAIEHVQDSGLDADTGGTINLAFGVVPTTGNPVVVMIRGYNNLGPPAPYWSVSDGGRFDVNQHARSDRTSKCAPGPGRQIRGPAARGPRRASRR
jgi:hypothetical protein